MYPRAQLARALQLASLVISYQDYFKIAEALERGDSRDDILRMSELQSWPKAHEWLKARL